MVLYTTFILWIASPSHIMFPLKPATVSIIMPSGQGLLIKLRCVQKSSHLSDMVLVLISHRNYKWLFDVRGGRSFNASVYVTLSQRWLRMTKDDFRMTPGWHWCWWMMLPNCLSNSSQKVPRPKIELGTLGTISRHSTPQLQSMDKSSVWNLNWCPVSLNLSPQESHNFDMLVLGFIRDWPIDVKQESNNFDMLVLGFIRD